MSITADQKRQYVQDGYFVLERVIPPEHLEILRDTAGHYMNIIHRQMDEKKTDVLGLNHRNSRYFINNRFAEAPALRQVLFSDYMADICRATLGSDAYLFHEQYVIKAAEKGMKFAWHQDSGYVDGAHPAYVSCWCALDDMTEANGTVYMLPYGRAGTRTRIEHKQEAGSNDLVAYFGSDPGEPVLCPAGSIAVFSSTCFHRSGTNSTSRMRRVYLPQYSPQVITKKDGSGPWALAEPFLKGGRPVAG